MAPAGLSRGLHAVCIGSGENVKFTCTGVSPAGLAMNPELFKEKVAIFLNEHPEFFNDYPELLAKIKLIEESDLPLPPLHTMSVADRIIQRVRDDRENIKSKLEWFIELARKNEQIHQHLYEIERLALSSTELLPMLAQLRTEIMRRFDIRHVVVCLAADYDHVMETRLQERFPEPVDGALRFVEQKTLCELLENGAKPILRGEINAKSKIFNTSQTRGVVQSEALVPIVIRDTLVGCMGLGSANPYHFYEELGTDFLERMAGKLAIAIDNILLLERLKNQSVRDPLTGHYNRAYFDPVLLREFDRSRRYGKKLSCVMMCIDYFDDLIDTYSREKSDQILKETGNILTGCCRTTDVIVRYDDTRFFIVLPETHSQGAVQLAERIRQAIEADAFQALLDGERITASLGVTTYPSKSWNSYQELVRAASTGLTQAVEQGGNRVVSSE